ncbi:MAG: 3-deoxy-manno-octulosonate cytidylyltransferase [Erythrobacter sp.]
MHKIAIIIPARLKSSRFPAKPLAMIEGPDGCKRLAISYTWDAALAAARLLDGHVEVVVATDDGGIANACESLDMRVVMTPESCRNGTERCAAALGGLNTRPDVVVNLQGDALLTPADMVRAVVARLESSDELAMATPVIAATPAVLGHLQADAAAGRVGGTTAACATNGRALYFSKSIIPYAAPGTTPVQPILLHIGLYAYRPAALETYAALAPTPLELQEGLEQLRFLDAGLPVGTVLCETPLWDIVELNNPTDVPLIEAELIRRASQETVQ